MLTIKKYIKYLEYLLIILITSYLYLSNIELIKFHPDESQWITTSIYFDALIDGNTQSEIWEPGYWTLTQPPVTRYIIGFARKLSGFGTDQINNPWNFSLDRQTNIAQGALPKPELLKTARTPMTVMAVLSIFLLFYIARKYFGVLSAYILFILLISNNYLAIHLTRALSESALLFFIIVVTILIYIASRILISENNPIRENKTRLIFLLIIMTSIGVIIGITGGIKLNGFALLGVGTVLFTIILFFSAYLTNVVIKIKILILAFIVMVLTITSFSTFISYNPFLYNNTIDRTVAIFKWRIHESTNQRKNNNKADLTEKGIVQRTKIVTSNIFNKYSTLTFKSAIIFNIGLFLVGVVLSLKKSVYFIKGNKKYLPYLILILTSIIVSGPLLLTPLNWDRYFYLPVIFSTIFISVGISLILKFIYIKYVLQQFTTHPHAHS
ncbi:MAG TPA: hypothetical protein VLB82_12210 [Thermodesulfobacteriota bacterium]|nr:hypothetical protein [Thermodesulfobacteriota bacterium]